mmetsp:Transcript_1886/g.3916  ORF Transcript_1886/g.3916 Transcript_1886/m.3916 type:complete len:615 (-) Transcript_1886:94-1938(-)
MKPFHLLAVALSASAPSARFTNAQTNVGCDSSCPPVGYENDSSHLCVGSNVDAFASSRVHQICHPSNGNNGNSNNNYLCTLVKALEYKLGGETPELLSKKRTVDVSKDQDGNNGNSSAEVYGPVALSPFFPGNTFEVWTLPSEDDAADDENNDETSTNRNDNTTKGGIAVVLGAGNQSFLTLMDVLDNCLRHRRPVLVKHHPLREWLAKPYGIMLAPLYQRGYFAQVSNIGNDATRALLSDPAVGHVHITGAYKTARAVREILSQTRPHLSSNDVRSMVTSELGCATPHVLDDGSYTDAELRHACRTIAFGKKANGGCNCLCAQAIVLPRRWAQKDRFRSVLFDELRRQPTMPCYYPGSVERKASIVLRCKKAGTKCTTVIAPSISEETLVRDRDQVVVVECGTPGEEGYNPEPLLTEAFGPILAIVELDHDGSDENGDYIPRTAVPFLNNKENIFGSLSCSIYTPASNNGTEHNRQGLQSAVASLDYGAICINQLNILGYLTATKGGKWGGVDALGQSGNGNVGDLYGIIGSNKTAKAVVYGPPLETKPLFDLGNGPPNVVLDALMEIVCSPSVYSGMVKVFKLIVTRSVYGIVSMISHLPMIGGGCGGKSEG